MRNGSSTDLTPTLPETKVPPSLSLPLPSSPEAPSSPALAAEGELIRAGAKEPVSKDTASTAPNLFDSMDYREFLAQWFAFKKTVQPSFSGAVFARKAGLQSHSLLGMVIRGDRNLSPETTRAFGRALEFNSSQMNFFERLVLFNQAKNTEDKFHYLSQLHQAVPAGRSRDRLKWMNDYVDYISNWYQVIIREMVPLKDFRVDAEWMSERLKGRVTAAQCERAWQNLNRLGMVKQNAEGQWAQTDPKLEIEPKTFDAAVRAFHSSYLDHARTSAVRDTFNERELGFLTVSVPHSDWPLLVEKIRQFRTELHQLFPTTPEAPGLVVSLGVQLIQMTSTEAKLQGDKK